MIPLVRPVVMAACEVPNPVVDALPGLLLVSCVEWSWRLVTDVVCPVRQSRVGFCGPWGCMDVPLRSRVEVVLVEALA